MIACTKQVIGQQNFVMGATISILLLAPTEIAFVIDRMAQLLHCQLHDRHHSAETDRPGV